MGGGVEARQVRHPSSSSSSSSFFSCMNLESATRNPEPGTRFFGDDLHTRENLHEK